MPGSTEKQNTQKDVIMSNTKESAIPVGDSTLINQESPVTDKKPATEPKDGSVTVKTEPEKENSSSLSSIPAKTGSLSDILAKPGCLSTTPAENATKRKRDNDDVGHGRCPTAPMDIEADDNTPALSGGVVTSAAPPVGSVATRNQLPSLRPAATSAQGQNPSGRVVMARTPLPNRRPMRVLSGSRTTNTVGSASVNQPAQAPDSVLRGPVVRDLGFKLRLFQAPRLSVRLTMVLLLPRSLVLLLMVPLLRVLGPATNGPAAQGIGGVIVDPVAQGPPDPVPGQQGVQERKSSHLVIKWRTLTDKTQVRPTSTSVATRLSLF